MQGIWFRTALINLFIAASLGLLMRYLAIHPIEGLHYRNITHAHSHVAMLGWIYMGLYIFLIYFLLPTEKQHSPFYNWLFWLTELSVIGMLVAFPIQGYAGFSIAFSTLHIICSYAFARRFWKDLSETPHTNDYVQFFAKTALVTMVLSTFAIWGMPYLMIKGFKGTSIYHAAVQFYLHFQFNGWMIFALLALFFQLLANSKITVPADNKTFDVKGGKVRRYLSR